MILGRRTVMSHLQEVDQNVSVVGSMILVSSHRILVVGAVVGAGVVVALAAAAVVEDEVVAAVVVALAAAAVVEDEEGVAVAEDEEGMVVAEDEAAVDVRNTKKSTKCYNRSTLVSPWTIKTVRYVALRSHFIFHSFRTHQQ